MRELDLFGVYLSPMLACLAAAAVAWQLARWLLRRWALYAFVWHPPLFDAALYVVLLAGVVALARAAPP